MDSKDVYLGIDYGTTNTVAYSIRDGSAPEIITNSFGDQITPSCVLATENGLIVGRAALNERLYSKDYYFDNCKRHMGQVDDEGKPIEILYGPDGTGYTPGDIAKAVLQEMKASAQKHFNCDIDKVVISVPAYFKSKAKEHTVDAGKRAGFKEVRLITEPVAACLAFDPKNNGSNKIAVFDFGGGTFDISIIESNGTGNFDVLSISGNQNLGGSDLDDILVKFAVSEAEKQGIKADLDNLQIAYPLADSCRKAKETMSHSENGTICVDNREDICKVRISRSKYIELVNDAIIQPIKGYCNEALSKASLEPSDIDIVVLVGGSSRNCFVNDIIQDVFHQEPRRDIDMDKSVAIGGAAYSASIFSIGDKPINVGGKFMLASELNIQNRSPRDICLAVMRGVNGPEYNEVLIPANSKLPFSENFRFTPNHPQASTVLLKLYDGGADRLSSEQTPLKTAKLNVKPVNNEHENTDRIQVTVNMNDEGLVNINAVDKYLNQPIDIELKFDVASQSDESSGVTTK